MSWSAILARTPVNKITSVVINQCGCADSVELNRLVDQRVILKARFTALQNARNKGSAERRRELFQISKDLAKLNKQLKPVDRLKNRIPKTNSEAFMSAAAAMLDEKTFNSIRVAAGYIKEQGE